MIGILGAGIGGLTAAIALRQAGHAVVVFEQAQRFARVGADINLTPNAVRALDGIGVGEALREHAARPKFRISRMWDTGEETSRLGMAEEAEAKYGAPQLTLHRADLMSALEAALPAECVRLGHRASGVVQDEAGVTIDFTDGSTARVDALIGADGIHSVARTALFGQESPRFTGVVAFRAVVPAERLPGSRTSTALRNGGDRRRRARSSPSRSTAAATSSSSRRRRRRAGAMNPGRNPAASKSCVASTPPTTPRRARCSMPVTRC
jgi:salicylate hydroxylase